jgi:hypothetical protein
LGSDDSFPEYACSYPNPAERRRLASSRPFESLAIRDLLERLPFHHSWFDECLHAAQCAGIDSAKVAVAFPNLKYRPELAANSNPSLRFLGNVPWPDGRGTWVEAERLRLRQPPFPTLVQDESHPDTFSVWNGILHLPDWTDFASNKEVSLDGWAPSRGRLGSGDLRLRVHRPEGDAVAPSAEQTATMRQFLATSATLLDEILAELYRHYGPWREDFYGAKVSSDGGRTWQTGWDLPQQFPPKAMPPIASPAGLRRLIRPSGVHIMTVPRDGLTCVGVGFACRWDDEHGLGVSTHNGRVLSVGQAEEAFREAVD